MVEKSKLGQFKEKYAVLEKKYDLPKYEELNENFQIMYGKGASFIDPKNVNEVTKTLNSLFLERNLIS